LCQLHRYPEAERSAREALALYPDLVQMYQVLGYACAARGEIDDAIAHLEHSLSTVPDDDDARLGLARILVGEGRVEEADAQLDLIAARMAGDPQYELVLGTAKLAQRRYEEALAPLERSLTGTINDGPAVRLYASALIGLERFAEAENRLHAFHDQFPQVVSVANDLAWLLATCPDERIRNGEDAVVIASNLAASPQGRSAMVLDTLAAAYAEAGRFDDALRTMDEALELARSAGTDASRLRTYESRRTLYASRKAYRTEPARTDQP
jgi:tetratricopeptide (TPR) repeat protein